VDASAELTAVDSDRLPAASVGRALERASAVFVALLAALVVAAVAVHEARASRPPDPASLSTKDIV
jgi:hypothetical protein